MEQPGLSEITKMSNGDRVFEGKIFEVIKKEFPLEKEQYFESLEKRDLIKAAEDVHKLKHKVSILGLAQGYIIATDYENNLKKGSFELKVDFEAILEKITAYIVTL